MHKLDPNEMDALFRDGADQHEFTYNPEAWALMEEKLDNNKRKKLFFWWILGVLTLVSVVGLFSIIYSSSSPESIVSKDTMDITKTEMSNSINPEEGSEVAFVKSINEGERKIEDENTINKRNITKTTPVKSIIGKEEYVNTDSKVSSSYVGAQNSFQSENTGSLVDSEVASVSPQESTIEGDRSSVIANTNSNDKISDENIEFIVSDLNNEVRGILDFGHLEHAATYTVSSVEEEDLDFDLELSKTEQSILSTSGNRFVFTGFASTDYSSVGFFKDPQSGFTVGGKVGLQVADKWQFDLGLAYSLKRYGSEGIDYNLEGGWNSMTGVSPTWMDGKGNILQVPMEVSYYFNGYRNNSFFINAGITSLIFNSEWYGFKYDPEDLLQNPDAIVEITMDDISRKNFHPAGIARISAGYQRVMSTNMALEISPYLQVPLTGIGEGRVDLYTAGLQMAVKFNTK